MKHLAILLSFLMLVGCGSDSEPGEGGETVDPIDDNPTVSLNWGDLKCQQEGRCENSVLNLSVEKIKIYLLEHYLAPIEGGADSFEKAFLCGSKSFETWTLTFPQHDMLADDEFSEVGNFLEEVLNMDNCQLEPDYIKKINEYFENTKEYQNEIQ